jgi:heme exporter protein A
VNATIQHPGGKSRDNSAVDDERGNQSLAITVAGLRRDYGERTALDGLGFELETGGSLAVLGPNGSGKTTLLRVLATLLRPTAGEVRVLGCALPEQAWKLRGRVGYLGHEPLLYRDLSGRENLRFHARLHGLSKAAAGERIESLLRSVGMERRAGDRVSSLSAGMRQRLAICRCVIHEPELLLLDEPDSNLDLDGRELARALIGRGASRTRVLVTHDPERALPDVDRALVLGHGGHPLSEGPAAELDPERARAAAAGAPA